MTRLTSAAKPRLITPYRVGVSLLLALAMGLLYAGFVSSVDRGGKDLTVRDQRVETVLPVANGTALRQSRIFVQLAEGFTGVLVVDGTEIPEDQLDHREGANTVGYTPGEGTETGELKPGQRCATVVYWPVSSTRALGSESYKWCWQVH